MLTGSHATLLSGTHTPRGLSPLSVFVLSVLLDSVGQWIAEEGPTLSTRDQFGSSPLLTLKQNWRPREPTWTSATVLSISSNDYYMPHTYIKSKVKMILLLDSEHVFVLSFYTASLTALTRAGGTGPPGDDSVVSEKAPKPVPGTWFLHRLTQSASPMSLLCASQLMFHKYTSRSHLWLYQQLNRSNSGTWSRAQAKNCCWTWSVSRQLWQPRVRERGWEVRESSGATPRAGQQDDNSSALRGWNCSATTQTDNLKDSNSSIFITTFVLLIAGLRNPRRTREHVQKTGQCLLVLGN